jgi:hypothetical protein
MTMGETIAVAVAVVDVAYVVWGYHLRTALDRTKPHLIPLLTDPSSLRANSRDATTWRAPRLFHTNEPQILAR